MKRVAEVLLLIVTVFVGTELLRVAFAGRPPTAIGNGDINGDQQIDIADAVALLEFLFVGEAPPAAIAASADLEARVAALEDLLQDFRRDGDTVVFEGANLQIVNGLGATTHWHDEESGCGNS